MSYPASFLKKFWQYLVFYPESDEPDYDGEHDGGIKDIREDAPESAKKAYAEFLEIEKKADENGICI